MQETTIKLLIIIAITIAVSGCGEPEQVGPDKQLIRSEIRATCEDWSLFYKGENERAMIRTLDRFLTATQVNEFKSEYTESLDATKLNGVLSLDAAFGNFAAARDSLFSSKKTYPVKSACIDKINDEYVIQSALSWRPKYKPTFFETIKKKIGL